MKDQYTWIDEYELSKYDIEQEVAFECEYCNEIFLNEEKNETEGYTYACNECAKNFYTCNRCEILTLNGEYCENCTDEK